MSSRAGCNRPMYVWYELSARVGFCRFPCCGKLYPCDKCHDEKEVDHEMELANRMLCGFCSKEQVNLLLPIYFTIIIWCYHAVDYYSTKSLVSSFLCGQNLKAPALWYAMWGQNMTTTCYLILQKSKAPALWHEFCILDHLLEIAL